MVNERISITLDATDNVSGKLKNVNKQLGGLGNVGKKSAAGLKPLTNALGNMENILGAGVAGLGLQSFVGALGELNRIGTQSQGMAQIFTAMAGGAVQADALLQQLQTTTSNVVSDFDLMAGSSQLMRMGLANTSDEVNDLIEMAVKLKQPTDSASDAIENFSLMLANQSVMRLDSFGISSGKVRQKIDELLQSGKALNREEAFTMAVMEQGAVAIERLGSAADVSVSSLNRVNVQLQNFLGGVAEFTATGVESGAMILETVFIGAESVAEGKGADFGAAFINAVFSEITGAELPTIEAQQAALNPQYAMPSARSNYDQPRDLSAAGQAMIDMNYHLNRKRQENNAYDALQSMFASAASGIGTAGQGIGAGMYGIARNMSVGTQSTFANSQRYFSLLSQGVSGGTGNMGLMTTDAISSAINGYEQMANYAEQIAENPFVTEGEVQKINALVDRAAAFKDQAIAAQQAFDNMSLGQMLGRGPGGRAGELSDMILSNIDDDARAGVQTDFDLATGRESQLGLAIENDIAPQIADITQKLGSDIGIQAMEAALAAVEQGQIMGHSDSQIAGAAQFATIQELPLFQDMQSMAGGLFGGGGEDGENAGEILPNLEGKLETIGMVQERVNELGEVASGVEFHGMMESAMQIASMMGETLSIVDQIAQDRSATVKVNIKKGDVDPEALKALGQQISSVVMNNGGLVLDQ